MKKLTNTKKNENKKILLEAFSFSNIQEAKKYLGMKKDKASMVYEELMYLYNDQIDEIKKIEKKKKYKEKKQINKTVENVKMFNQNSTSVTFTNITKKQLEIILKNLDLTKRVVMSVDGKYYTLSPEKVNKMMQDIEQFWVEELENYGTNYNADLLLRIKDVREVTILRPKWNGKNKNEGAFFKYYHNIELDLDGFGVHKEKQEKYNENCFVQALIILGIDDDIVKGIRSLICSKYLPTNKLTQIADKYKLYFRIKTLDKHKDTINFGDKKIEKCYWGLLTNITLLLLL